jgi:prolipoprotein diacylglyceryltransferase
MFIHFLFDLLAMAAAVTANTIFRNTYLLSRPASMPVKHQYTYLLVLLLGMIAGSIMFGSLNVYLAGLSGFGKSLLGGIAGAVLVAELFKKGVGVQGSTGLYFIPGLCVLIIVGRVGCFLAGLPDYTYGVATDMPWGFDFGDGVRRHPVQLYEGLSMLVFLLVFLTGYKKHQRFWMNNGFYLFVLFYAGQRFVWEFLKPYPTIIIELNVFHVLALVMVVYAVIMLFLSSEFAIKKSDS